jgi:hypothetical protein
MVERLYVRDKRQFEKGGIRKLSKHNYELKEGIITPGAESEHFYMERAKRLYTYEAVDRIILISGKKDSTTLEKFAEKILGKSRDDWRRYPDDWLRREGERTFTDKVEIVDSERRGTKENVEIVQINLVSSLYSTAECYLSQINENPNELPMRLVRMLAGLYPEEWKEDLPEGIPHYDPKDILKLLTLLTSDTALITYFGTFREFLMKKSSNIEEMHKKLEVLLKTPTSFHEGLKDLNLILRIIDGSLSLNSLPEILELQSEIDNYFIVVPNPERYTDMLYRKFRELFNFLQEFQETNDFQDKLYFLEGSRKIIRESEILVDEKFVNPFKRFYSKILRKWMDITFEEGGKLLGSASLEAKLQTRRIIWKEKVVVSLNIKNVGMGTAENITVALDDSSDYELSGNSSQIIEVLPRNRHEDVEFLIIPQREDRINLNFSVSHGDRKPIKISDTLIFVDQEEFVTISNPYNFTRPTGKKMFFNREDLFQWVKNNMEKSMIYQNVLITGQRRIGKTSFLRELQRRMRRNHYCIFMDLELYPDLTDSEFLRMVCQKLHKVAPNSSSPPNPQEFASKSYMAFGDYVRSIPSDNPRDTSSPKKIVLIFDEFDKIQSKIEEGTFKPGFLLFFRAFFQHNPRANAVIGGKFDFEKLQSPEWKEFFTIFNPKIVGILDEDSATALVTRPVKKHLQYDQYAVKKILDFSGRNPFYIQLICHILINYLNKKEKNFVDVEDISTVILNEAREGAEPVLRLAWDELDPMEKNILYALSRLKIQYRRAIEHRELRQHLRQNNIKIKTWKLNSLISTLKEKDIITRSGGSSPFYDFNIQLLGDWIAEKGNFGR